MSQAVPDDNNQTSVPDLTTNQTAVPTLSLSKLETIYIDVDRNLKQGKLLPDKRKLSSGQVSTPAE